MNKKLMWVLGAVGLIAGACLVWRKMLPKDCDGNCDIAIEATEENTDD